MTIIFLNLGGASTSYATFVVVISILAVFLAIAYAPWMASFTETVEKRNPALTATGLAVWGWIIRVVIAVSVLILPLGGQLDDAAGDLRHPGRRRSRRQYPQQLATLGRDRPEAPRPPSANPADTAAQAKAVGEIATAFKVTPAVATTRLVALAAVPKADQAFLAEHGAAGRERGRRRARPVEELVVGMRRWQGPLPAVHPGDGGPVEPPQGARGRGRARSPDPGGAGRSPVVFHRHFPQVVSTTSSTAGFHSRIGPVAR